MQQKTGFHQGDDVAFYPCRADRFHPSYMRRQAGVPGDKVAEGFLIPRLSRHDVPTVMTLRPVLARYTQCPLHRHDSKPSQMFFLDVAEFILQAFP